MRARATLLAVLLLGFAARSAWSQSVADPPPNDPNPAIEPDQPIPYDPAEFQPWLRDLRRAEIIAVGAFPIAMIASGIGYQLGRFAYVSGRRGEPALDVAPFFFSTSTEPRYDAQERLGLVISGALISTLVATADWWLGRRERD